MSVDRRIVSHLRRDLTRRLERRITMLSFESSSEGDSSENNDDRLSKQQRHETPRDIYNMYSDTGERLPRILPKLGKDDIKEHQSHSPLETVTGISEGEDRIKLERDSSLLSLGSRQRSGYLDTSQGASEKKATTKSTDSKNKTASKNNSKNDTTDRAKEQPSEVKLVAEEREALSYTELSVSPVPTPSVFRPQLFSSDPQMNRQQRVNAILQGRMDLECPLDDRVIRLYIHSCSSDTDPERTALIQQSYSDLRDECQERGYDLQIVDMRWTSRDMLTDSHTAHQLTHSVINSTATSPHSVNFITFVSQKYGDTMLPTKISLSEFEAILAAVKEESLKQEQEAAERAQEKQKASIVRQLTVDSSIESSSQSSREQSSVGSEESNLDFDQKRFHKNKMSQAGKPAAAAAKTQKEPTIMIPDPDLLTAWYTLEENLVPPAYTLQKISSQYPDIVRGDASKRSQARTAWQSAANSMREMLSSFSHKVLTPEASKKYRQSQSIMELEQIIKGCKVPASNMLWIHREIEDIKQHLYDEVAPEFIDINTQTSKVDKDKQETLEGIKDKLVNMLPVKNHIKYTVSWGPNGVDPTKNRPHASYLERLSRDFKDNLMSRLVKGLPQHVTSTADEWLTNEVTEHAKICNKWSREFHGRKEALVRLKKYLISNTRRPVVVYGNTGSGMTALLSRLTANVHGWLRENEPIVMFRSVGATPSSQSPRMLLHGLCLQLCKIFNNDPKNMPEDYRGLQNEFEYRLGQTKPESPLIIIIDALHNFKDDEAKEPTWLPIYLPKDVKIIVSTAKEEKYESLKTLQVALTEDKDCLFELDPLPMTHMKILVNHWLSVSKKSLTKQQMEYLYKNMTEYPIILYWKVLVTEALQWPYTLTADQIKLPNSLKRLMGFVFARMEKDYGDALVKRALGYITCARNGLTESELLDLLSLDEAVMDEVSAQNRPPIRRFPAFGWLRLREDLGEKLLECDMDNQTVIRWSHVAFEEVATERYLNQRDKSPSYHKLMAEYFSGTWFNNPKPCPGYERGLPRYIMNQPLYREYQQPNGNMKRVYNLRRINELPAQLLKSQQFELLKRNCLCNFEWVLAKLCATSIHSLFEDLQMALQVEPTDPDLNLVSDTLHLSRVALSSEPKQLASQVVGRLQKVMATDVPIAPADPLKYPYVHPFYEQAKKSSIPSLVPNVTCLTEPGGILFDLLSGHTDEITAVATCNSGQKAVTASRDNTMKIWELRTGKVKKTVAGVGRNVTAIRLGVNDSLICTSEVGNLRFWKLSSGECLKTFDQYADPPITTIASKGQFLVAFFDGSGVMKVWDLTNDIKLHKEKIVLDSNEIHQDGTFVVSVVTNGPRVLYAVRSSNEAIVTNCNSGNIVRRLKCREKSASVCALSGTSEYWVVGVRCNYMQLHELYVLDVFDQENGALLRTIRGCMQDTLEDLHVNAIGSHAMSICCSESSNSSNIAVWNIETEDHKHLAKHAAISRICACADLKYCLTAAEGENSLRIWNLTGKINIPVKRREEVQGVEEIIPMNNPRYVIAKLKGSGALSVWNVLTGKCRGSAVRIARGLVDPSDILLVHKTRVVILAEKGFSETQKDRALFKTVFIYDLKTKKYVRKLTGCFIAPAPANEYMILDDEHLMGLSESRTHFVVWSLVTGHVAYRIKTNFDALSAKRDNNVFDESKILRKRNTTAYMTPWEKRSETKTARHRRHTVELNEEKQKLQEIKKERENSVEQFIVSGDGNIIVASFFGHHLCVFDVQQKKNIQILDNVHSMLHIHTAAITYDGKYLVHPNYDDDTKTSYVTLWSCLEGHVKKRLRNERHVCAVAISDDGSRVVIGKSPNELRVWEPGRVNSFKKAKGHKNLNFGSTSQIYIIESGTRAAVFAGDVSVWDLEHASLLAVFTPDMKIQCFNIALGGKLLVLGMRDSNEVVTLRLMSGDQQNIDAMGENVFDEVESSSSEEEEEDEEEEDDDVKNK